MSVTDILSKIAGRQQKRQKTSAERFARLVAQVADGKEPAEADEVLEASGRTAEDLAREVQRLVRRREAAEKVKLADAVAAERAQLEEKAAAAQRKLEAAQRTASEQWAAAIGPIQERLRVLELLERQGRQAADYLRDTCEDSELLARLDELRRRATEARAKAGLEQKRGRDKASESITYETTKRMPWRDAEYRQKSVECAELA